MDLSCETASIVSSLGGLFFVPSLSSSITQARKNIFDEIPLWVYAGQQTGTKKRMQVHQHFFSRPNPGLSEVTK
jgi:hypothetical protein